MVRVRTFWCAPGRRVQPRSTCAAAGGEGRRHRGHLRSARPRTRTGDRPAGGAAHRSARAYRAARFGLGVPRARSDPLRAVPLFVSRWWIGDRPCARESARVFAALWTSACDRGAPAAAAAHGRIRGCAGALLPVTGHRRPSRALMHYFMGVDHKRNSPAPGKRRSGPAGAPGGREMSQYRDSLAKQPEPALPCAPSGSLPDRSDRARFDRFRGISLLIVEARRART